MKRTTRLAMPKIVEIQPDKSNIFTAIKAMCEKNVKFYRMGGCLIQVGLSEEGWHLSISAKNRYPTWDEVAHARYELLPENITMAMLLPPMDDYINIAENCLQIWEVPSSTGITRG